VHHFYFSEMLFWRLHLLIFPRPKQCKTPRKHPSYTSYGPSAHYTLIARIFKECVFWGAKGHDPEQSKDLETRMKMPRGNPKNTSQCQNPPEIPKFCCGAEAPCRRAPAWIYLRWALLRAETSEASLESPDTPGRN